MMRRGLIALLSVGLVTAALLEASAADRRFAVVVGFNGSDDPELEHLAYADDDAMRYSQLLGHVAERVELLLLHGDVLAQVSRQPKIKIRMADVSCESPGYDLNESQLAIVCTARLIFNPSPGF